MVSTNDMRPGQSIIVDNILYQILEYQHVKPGKGKAFVKTKLKNLSNGGNIEKTFRADEDVQQAYIDKQLFQFLYNDSDEFYFMNNESFEQISINRSILDGQEILLKPNEEVTIAMHENNPIDIFSIIFILLSIKLLNNFLIIIPIITGTVTTKNIFNDISSIEISFSTKLMLNISIDKKTI